MTWIVWMVTLEDFGMSPTRCNGMRYGGLMQRVENVDFLSVDSDVGNGLRRRQLQGLQASFYPHTSVQAVSTLSLPKDLKIILG